MGWYSRGKRLIRSTTLTTRTFSSGARFVASERPRLSRASGCRRRRRAPLRLKRPGRCPPTPTSTRRARSVRSRLHVEALELRLLVDHDEVHVVAAAQAVVGDRQQAVGVGRQVDAGHAPPLGQDHVDQPGALMAEPVVVVAPASGGQQDIERGNRFAPRQSVRPRSHFVCCTVIEAETMANAS